MARHYLHLHHDGRDRRWRATERSDIGAVHDEAIDGIRAVLRDQLSTFSRLDLSGRVEVIDEAGETVLVVPFVEAMQLPCARD
ncbi:MAG: DUF6894 family protein [Allosphingosinicella sp.]|uniref:DUF6894 family protein n=1 Tax=Allosphingosinicella sp. TaxID=2823234 RepID=UPI003960AB11